MLCRWTGICFFWASFSSSFEPDALVEPHPEPAVSLLARLHGHALLLTTIWVPRTLTTNVSRGRGRRARDVLAVQVVVAVVAGAPDLAEVRSVLHRAVQVGADRGEGPEVTARGADQDPRAASELEDLPRIGLHVVGLDGQRHGPRGGLPDGGGDQVARHRIDDGEHEGHRAGPEQPVDESPPVLVGLEHVLSHEGPPLPAILASVRRSSCLILSTRPTISARITTRDTASPLRRNPSSPSARTPRP